MRKLKKCPGQGFSEKGGLPDYVIFPLGADKFGNALCIQAVALNRGEGDAQPNEDSISRIYVNDNTFPYSVHPLRKGEHVLHVLDYNCTRSSVVSMTAIADFSGSVRESDETNNARSIQAKC